MRLIDRARKVFMWAFAPWDQCRQTGVHHFTPQYRYGMTADGYMVTQRRLRCIRCAKVMPSLETAVMPAKTPLIDTMTKVDDKDPAALVANGRVRVTYATEWIDKVPVFPGQESQPDNNGQSRK